MYGAFEDKIIIPLPKGVLDLLDKKTKAKVEAAINGYREQGSIRMTENHGYSNHSHYPAA